MAVKAGFPAEKTVEVYDSWYGLPQNPYKKDTDTVLRESSSADLVLGEPRPGMVEFSPLTVITV